MTIENDTDLQGLKRIGKIVGEALRAMEAQVQPGITTRELDQVGWQVLKQHGARPAPLITYQFPGVACISINDEAAHGIPGQRVVKRGDLVKLDMSAELDGYFADAAITVPVAPIHPSWQRLCDCTQQALDTALVAARAGQPINSIGRVTEDTARRSGFSIIRELPGHGVGRALHEEPNIPNFYNSRANQKLHEGLVITIEPYIALRGGSIFQAADGWTLKTRDGSPVANNEHTVVITQGRPIIITM